MASGRALGYRRRVIAHLQIHHSLIETQSTPTRHRRPQPRSMDMDVQLPSGFFVDVDLRTPASEYASLAEHRQRLFTLIGDFQRALAEPRSLAQAVRVLKAILPCSDAYFSLVESVLDKISAAGAAPHRGDHSRILVELKNTLDRCSAADSPPAMPELTHALDSLVMHETAISLRAPENTPRTRQTGIALPV